MSNRIAWWDNLKFVLMLLVVVGHFAEPLAPASDPCKSIFLFIYTFHMPLFFFISGLFHSDRNLFPKVLFFLCGGFALKITLSVVNFLTGKPLTFQLLSDSYLPWFLFVLSDSILLCALFRRQNKWFLCGAFVLLACFAGLDPSVEDFLYLSRLIVFFPFYLFGSLLDPNALLHWRQRHRRLLFPALFLLGFWIFLCFARLEWVYPLRRLFTGRNPFSDVFGDFGPLARLLCYVLSILTGGALLFLVPTRPLPLVSRAGRETLRVYFWHWPCYLLLEQVVGISRWWSAGPLGKAAFWSLPVLLTVVLSISPICSFPLAQIRAAIAHSDGAHTRRPSQTDDPRAP